MMDTKTSEEIRKRYGAPDSVLIFKGHKKNGEPVQFVMVKPKVAAAAQLPEERGKHF